MKADLFDRIYECSFAPELWPGVLDELAIIADARGGHIFAQNPTSTKVECWTCSETMQFGMEYFVASDIVSRGERGRRAIALRHPGFVTEHDIYPDPETERDKDPYYSELLFRAELGWGTSTAISLPHGGTAFLTLERELQRGPVEAEIIKRLDVLRPHLARSALMSARLQMERAHAAAKTLALLGLPALVFDENGKVLAANHLVEAETEHVRWRAHGRVALKDTNADALFRAALETIGIGSAPTTRSFALRGGNGRAEMVAHVIPIRRTARDIFSRSAGILTLASVGPQRPLPIELLEMLFDLTPAEARVANRVVAGDTVEEIADAGDVATSTVKTHLHRVFEKTGCRRQAEVVTLLGGLAPPPG